MSGDRFNPEMLVIARSLREMTQGDLARSVGTTQGRVSKIEHGLIPPPPELLSEFSAKLKVPESFFFQPGYLYTLPTRHHRKRKQVSRRILDRIHAEITVRTMNIAQFLRSTEIEASASVPEIDMDEIGQTPEDIARLIREQWGLPRGPIPNLVEVLERAGVVIVTCDFGSPEVDAIGMRMQGGPPLMFVNKAMSVDRMRYTVAHELGHLVLHSLPREEMEKEADRFAAELLMPEADIRPQLANVTIELLAALKRVWRVSMAALLRRASQLKTITARVYTKMWQIFSAQGWRRREPQELDLSPEQPRLLAQMITFHRVELNFGLKQLSKIVHLDVEEFETFYPQGGTALRLVS